MSEGDYNRQAARRQRVNRATLIVGVDVGKAFNAVGFMNRMATYWQLCEAV